MVQIKLLMPYWTLIHLIREFETRINKTHTCVLNQLFLAFSSFLISNSFLFSGPKIIAKTREVAIVTEKLSPLFSYPHHESSTCKGQFLGF